MYMQEGKKDIKSIFIYIGIAISLVVTIVSFLNTVFTIIDLALLPDLFTWFDFRYEVFGGLPTSVAFLIVASVAWIVLSRAARATAVNDHIDVYHKLCQIVIMIVLTSSLITVLITGALLIKGVLDGDISSAYALKLAVTLIVGIAVFYYYRGVYRGVWQSRRKRERVYLSVAYVILVATIVAGVVAINPFHRVAAEEMYETLDQFKYVRDEARHIAVKKKEAQETLPKETYWLRQGQVRSDDLEVTYERVSASSFRLCGSFSTVPPEWVTELSGYPYDDFPVTEIGDVCFDFDVDFDAELGEDTDGFDIGTE